MTDWSISFDPVLPWAVIAVLAVMGLVLVGALAFTRTRGALLRALSLAVLLAALANPTIRDEVAGAADGHCRCSHRPLAQPGKCGTHAAHL